MFNLTRKDKFELTFRGLHPEKNSSAIVISASFYLIGGSFNDQNSGRTCVFPLKTLPLRMQLLSPQAVPCESPSLAEESKRVIYSVGGYILAEGRIMKECQKYLIKENKWLSAQCLNVARLDSACIAMNTELYCIGGKSWDAAQGKISLVDSIEVLSLPDEESGWSLLSLQSKPETYLANHSQGLLPTSMSDIMIIGGIELNNVFFKMAKTKAEGWSMKDGRECPEFNSHRVSNSKAFNGFYYFLGTKSEIIRFDPSWKRWS